MNYSIVIFISLIFLSTACVKEGGTISSGNVETGGGTSGGSTEIPGAEDPLASQAWHLGNVGQNTFSTGNGVVGEDISLDGILAGIDAEYTGEGVRIAISDSGTDINHEDLTGTQLVGEHRNYAISSPALWRSTLPYYVDDDAHGTAVAGLIAAEAWNGIGSRGVAPGAKYAAFRFIGDYDNSSSIARAVDQAGGDFDIFNYSWGYNQCAYTEEDPLVLGAYQTGALNLRSGRGAIYVQAAGNSFKNTLTLCAGNTNASDDLSSPYKVIVGAVNASGEKSSYSSPGSSIWVSAPGGEYGDNLPAMLTTDISGCTHGYSQMTYALNEFNRGSSLNQNCSYTSYMNGTSSATPVLTGVIALMLQAKPALTWRDVKNILARTSDKVDFDITPSLPIVPGTMSDFPLDHPLTPTSDGPGSYAYDYKWVVNDAGIAYSNWYGFGRVNALAAVVEANNYGFNLGTYVETDWADNDSGLISANIPENDPNGTLTGSLPASSLNVDIDADGDTFPDVVTIESVQIEVTIVHTRPKDVGIILVSPAGTESRVLHYNSGVTSVAMPAAKVLLTNAFYGETAAGIWKIKVVDGKANAITGTLTNWKIKINGGY